MNSEKNDQNETRASIQLRIMPKLSMVLTWLAFIYFAIFGVFTVFTLLGFSFVSKDVFLFLDKASFIFVFPTLAALYLNRAKRWANFLLTASPLAAWYLPLPSDFSWKFGVVLAVTPFFFLPGTNRLKRWIVGPIIVLYAFTMLLVVAVGSMWFGDLDIQKHDRAVVSTSPDKKYLIEAIGNDLGPPASIPTEVKLYYNYSGYPVKRLVRVLESNYSWPSKVEITWLDNKRVMIHGKIFNINNER